ncbi:glycine betaine ABC transporter substrate-binding protein [Paenibacillus donghaensis]|uniref:Glycine/betaine ABC transporter substrate-binding protein n=1 Tax=Paenibacillus donghaensis TaxID=414771 RepID=A0A2Z2KNN6_9BACL|nr:glycine betaine ABC transporter substrate-binding protein [Paenibacillus donghaensis]ASA24229.1 glycine/betaine ABC transporter substrate-binding protein [Paenibacillus donghaensis]
MKIKKIMIYTLFTALLGTILAGCGGNSKDGAAGGGSITIGSKNFTENVLLAHMMADLIEDQTDISVKRQMNLGGSNVAWTALENNEIQLFPDYTGTIVANYYQEKTGTSEESLAKARELAGADGLIFLEPFGINNTYTLAVTRATAEKYSLKTFSDLAKVSADMVLGVEFEFLDREDGYPGIKKLYGMNFKESKGMDHGIMYRAIDDGETDVTNAYATDAQIKVHDLVILEDDKEFFPPYDAGPVIRQETLDQHPELKEVLNQMGGVITETEMQDLNAKVDVDALKEEDVARDFLISKGLIKD